MNVRPRNGIVSTDAPAPPLPRFVTVTLKREKAVMTRSGRGATIVHLWVAGWPVLPARSVARTEKVCAPAGRRWNVRGLVHVAKGAPSSEQANADPGSLDENENTAEKVVDEAGGASSIVTIGGVVSGEGPGDGHGLAHVPGLGIESTRVVRARITQTATKEDTMKIRAFSPATVISVIALLFSLTGTAVAGALVTGANVRTARSPAPT